MYRFLKFSLLLFFVLGAHASSALTYYWIGGTGNWSDINHWSAVSGGSVMQLHTITPTSSDDVIIDAGSFPSAGGTITINVLNAYCRSFTVVSTPANVKINIQTGNTLRVFGNLTIQGRFARLGNGVVSFESSVLNRVVYTPRCPLGRVEFNSGLGSWLIQDTLQVTQVGIRAGKVYLGRSYFRATNVSGTGGQFHLDSGLIRIDDSYVLNGNVLATSANARLEMNGFNATDEATGLHKYRSIRFLGNRGYLSATANCSAKKVVLAPDQNTQGQWQADTLNMPLGGHWSLGNGSNLTLGRILAVHNCMRWGVIECNVVGGSATLNVGAGSPPGAFVHARDLNFGGSGWSASPVAKVGTVTGMLGTSSGTNTLYWIGGTGSWADPAHWSNASGGMPSGCIPGPLDTVVLDDNGGTNSYTVQLGNSDTRLAHSLLMSNSSKTVTVTGSGNFPLVLMGSLVLSNSSVWNMGRPLQFVGSDTSNIIDFKKRAHGNLLNIIGGGKWTLTDSAQVARMSLTHGTLKMKGVFASFGRFVDNETVLGLRFGSGINPPVLLPKWIIYGSRVRIQDFVGVQNGLFQVGADSSVVEIANAGRFETSNPNNQWNKVHWLPAGGEGRLTGSFHKIRQVEFDCDGKMECDLLMDTLDLAARKSYKFPPNIQYKRIKAPGNCNGYISFRPLDNLNLSTWNSSGWANTVQNTIFEKITQTNGTLLASNSINNGNVVGVTFTNQLGRVLYWVGGNGQWQDTVHWSLLSGGGGGECVPGPFDSVVVDNNSGTGSVTISLAGICLAGDFVVNTSSKSVSLNRVPGASPLTVLELFGSLHLSPSVNLQGLSTGGGTWIRLRTAPGNHSVLTHGVFVPLLQKTGTGTIQVLDSTRIGTFSQNDGQFTPMGNYFACLGDHYGQGGSFINAASRMYFGRWFGSNTISVPNSRINVVGHLGLSGPLNTSGSTVYMTGSQANLSISSSDTLVHVEYTNPQGAGTLNMSPNSYIGKMVFKGSCTFGDSVQCDTAMLANGRSYFFASNRTFRVKKWLDAHGDFCNPILMRATQQGQQAKIRTFDTVQGNFLEIRDLWAVGPKPFYSGNKSADQGGNTGIVWANKPGYVYGFGKDRYFVTCSGATNTSYLLTTERFQDAAGFLWMTGSTSDTMSVDSTGYYYVTAQYGGCTVTDTIGIFYNEVEFGVSDTLLCWGTSVDWQVLDSSYLGQVSILWSTGDTGLISLPWTVGVDTTLWFKATDVFGNWCSDTLRIRSVQYNSPPGGLTLLNCDTANLVQRLYTAFNWPQPDNYAVRWYGTWDSLAMTFQGWVAFDARFGGCWVRDSIPLYFGNPLGITPPGPNYCLGSTVAFSTAHPHSGYRYLWSTGDTAATTTKLIQATGYIKLRVTDDLGMTCTDSIAYVGGNSVVATLTPAVINGVQPWTDTVFGTATGAHRFYWIYGSDTLGSGFGISDSLIHTWNLAATGNLYFVGIDTIYGCVDTAAAQVIISQNYPAYVPNAFTPNGNTVNDTWTVQLLKANNIVDRAMIFNRFGNMVYYLENDEVSWPGTNLDGSPAETATYVYVLEFTDLNGRFYRLTGPVTLVR
jgi:gliding motility-associated-like protein